MAKLLPKSFYTRTDVVQVAKELLGKVLVSELNGQYTSGVICETEAYRAPDDKACHAYADRRTARTETMFAEGGVSYVYICYGIHHLFNVVTAEDGMAHAVLVRGVEPIDGIEYMSKNRGMKPTNKQMMNGPGKFTRAMNIYKEQDGLKLYEKKSKLYIEDRGIIVDPHQIIDGPRVGMATAEECSNWPWRYRIKDNPWTSKPDHVFYTEWA